MAGTLHIYTGGMYSGKSTGLARSILRAQDAGLKTLVLKPHFDTRYSDTSISTHSKLQVEAMSVTEYPLPTEKIYDIVFLDEIQFFIEPYFHSDIVEICKAWRNLGTHIVAAGLDMDWQGNPFYTTAMLCAMAGEVTKLKAICSVCGDDASLTRKVTHSGPVIELGSTDIYQAVCHRHADFNAPQSSE